MTWNALFHRTTASLDIERFSKQVYFATDILLAYLVRDKLFQLTEADIQVRSSTTSWGNFD